MRFYKIFFVLLMTLGWISVFPSRVFAETHLSPFKTFYEPTVPELLKPTVVSAVLPDEQRFGIAILEKESDAAQPHELIVKQAPQEPLALTVSKNSPLIGPPQALTDGDYKTTAEFDLDRDKGSAFLDLKASKAITSSGLMLTLDDHVALPSFITITASAEGRARTVMARTRLQGAYLQFPETAAQEWHIVLEHSQPLRFREIALSEKSVTEKTEGVEVRWLSQPGKNYVIYADAQSYFSIQTGEAGRLQGKDLEVVPVVLGEAKSNPLFREPDDDKDGVPNLRDNCVSLANPGQEDIDENDRGDACEDFDGDGVFNSQDNCPDQPNRNQQDTDEDDIGDVCDAEESRLTERNPWLPWVGMGIAALVVIFITIHTLKTKNK